MAKLGGVEFGAAPILAVVSSVPYKDSDIETNTALTMSNS